MVIEIEGYKFNNENAAKGAQAQLKTHYLGDANPSLVTNEWVSVHENNGSEGDFWYIIDDEQIGDVLNPHQKETFSINIID